MTSTRERGIALAPVAKIRQTERTRTYMMTACDALEAHLGAQMYDVEISLCVWTKPVAAVTEQFQDLARPSESKPQVAILHKQMKLPFAPFVGLEIRDGETDFILTRVRWDAAKSLFWCNVADEFPGKVAGVDYEQLLEWSLEQGWARPAYGGGNAPRCAT